MSRKNTVLIRARCCCDCPPLPSTYRRIKNLFDVWPVRLFSLAVVAPICVDDYEYDQSILEDAIKTLRREKIVDQNALHRLQLLQTVVGDMLAPNATPSTPNSAPTAHKAASEPAPLDAESGVFVPEKRMADAKDDQNASKRAKFSAGTDAQATRAEQQPVAPPTSTGALPASLDVVSADDDGGVTRMLDDDGDSHEPIDFAPKATVFSREMMDELNERYVEAMAELRFDAVEVRLKMCHSGLFRSTDCLCSCMMATDAFDITLQRILKAVSVSLAGGVFKSALGSSNQRKMERVLKECEALSTSLPLHGWKQSKPSIFHKINGFFLCSWFKCLCSV